MGIVLDMIGQGGKTVGAKKKDVGAKKKDVKKEIKATEEDKSFGFEKELDKEGEFSVRKSKSEKFRSSMRRQPLHQGKFSMGGPRIKKAR